MRRLFQIVHHRSQTASIVSVCFAFLSFGFLPEHAYRMQQQGASYFGPAAITDLLGLSICALTLVILLRDNRSGYPALRCSLATFLWALACVPVCGLTLVVVSRFFK
jgi:hypothetical protein